MNTMNECSFIDSRIENALTGVGYEINEEEYVTYADVWNWLWDNTNIKMYPYQEVDGSVSVYWQNPVDGTDDVLATSFRNSEEAKKTVIDYIVDNDMLTKMNNLM